MVKHRLNTLCCFHMLFTTHSLMLTILCSKAASTVVTVEKTLSNTTDSNVAIQYYHCTSPKRKFCDPEKKGGSRVA